jgi:hypothetical protein
MTTTMCQIGLGGKWRAAGDQTFLDGALYLVDLGKHVAQVVDLAAVDPT